MTITGSVGIFWGILNPDHSWSILTDKTSLEEAEPYGNFLTHPRGHYEVWNNWQELSAAARTKRAIPEAVAYHEYEDFPRGRIVYQTKLRQFILYADRLLQSQDRIAAITKLFDLPTGAYVVRSDAHYRSS